MMTASAPTLAELSEKEDIVLFCRVASLTLEELKAVTGRIRRRRIQTESFQDFARRHTSAKHLGGVLDENFLPWRAAVWNAARNRRFAQRTPVGSEVAA